MSRTTIEWTQRPGTIGETWNPTTGCNKVDRGCRNCYAEIMHNRLQAMNQEKYKHDFLLGAYEHPETLQIPYKWKKPRTVFVNSMSDLFHDDVRMDFVRSVFYVMEDTPQHTYIILTKRTENALNFWNLMSYQQPGWACPKNVWIGASVNDQASANKRIRELLKLTRCTRIVSYEPATGPVDFTRIMKENYSNNEEGTSTTTIEVDSLAGITTEYNRTEGQKTSRSIVERDHPRLHWVICGGESGPQASPMHPAWARKVRDDCKSAGVPFFFKQHGAWKPINYRNEDQELIIKFALGKIETMKIMTDDKGLYSIWNNGRQLTNITFSKS